jgi:polyisoprenoid-binding protein YceI
VAARAQAPLSLSSATVSLSGTSNIHEFTASTTDVKLTKLTVAAGVSGAAILANPLAVEAFEISIKAGSLSSPKEGLDKNMYKALKTDQFPEIVFTLTRLEGTAPALKAIGTLKIAGVEKPVTLDLKVVAGATALTVSGETPILTTDYGIPPVKAMMGMLKTDPKITVKFETVLAVPATF